MGSRLFTEAFQFLLYLHAPERENKLFKQSIGAGEMAQWLRTLAALGGGGTRL